MNEDAFIERITQIVESCYFDGGNILSAEIKAKELFKELKESPNE